ncbi:MAG: hypothetical protein HY077_11230 [Elusimicrobia bacterium]|nr:hypothetical protein [Elusimicrobiota bacterium]
MLRTLIAELKALRPIVWVILLCSALMAAFLYKHQDWRLHQTLYERGIHTQGWVTGKDLIGGRKVEYAFRAGEKTYRGTGEAGYGNPPFASLSADDQVLVFYLPQAPEVSALGDPKLHNEDQHRWMGWGLVLFLPPFLLALAAELKRHG